MARTTVVGPAASGAALEGAPVRVAGSDGTNAVDLSLDATGKLISAGVNESVTLLASAARMAAIQSADQTNSYHRGVVVTIDVTVDDAAAAVTFTIQGKDALSGEYYTILASTALAAVATTTLTVYPGNSASANSKADMPLPAVWRVSVTVADTDSMTYSVGASLIR